MSVRKQNGSSIDFSDPKRNKITITKTQYFEKTDKTNVLEKIYDLDENGKATMTVEIADNECSFYLKVQTRHFSIGANQFEFIIVLQAKYLDQESDLGGFHTASEPNESLGDDSDAEQIDLRAKVLTEK